MSIKDFEGVFTRKQFENIHDNLRAYLANFGYLKIAKADYGGASMFTLMSREPKAEVIHSIAITSIILMAGYMVQCRQSIEL